MLIVVNKILLLNWYLKEISVYEKSGPLSLRKYEFNEWFIK